MAISIYGKCTKKWSISVGKLKSTAKLLLFSETTKFFQKKIVFCLDYCFLAKKCKLNIVFSR